MTEYAIPGAPHTTIPATMADLIPSWMDYGVLPWTCPRCDQLVAETLVTEEPRHAVRTVLVAGSAVRDRAADEDGVPYFGPSRRAMHGKTERRKANRLANETFLRARNSREYRGGPTMPQADHAPIEVREFDTVCDNCPRRLRIAVPPL